MMVRKLALVLIFAATGWFVPDKAVMAQGCGPNNPNCIVVTMPPGDASDRAASDAFVQNAIGSGGGGGSPGGSNGQVQYNNASTFGGLTNVQLTALIQQFSSSLPGVVPASGGGTANFLRADGSFAVPPGISGSTNVFLFGSLTTPAGGL